MLQLTCPRCQNRDLIKRTGNDKGRAKCPKCGVMWTYRTKPTGPMRLVERQNYPEVKRCTRSISTD